MDLKLEIGPAPRIGEIKRHVRGSITREGVRVILRHRYDAKARIERVMERCLPLVGSVEETFHFQRQHLAEMSLCDGKKGT